MVPFWSYNGAMAISLSIKEVPEDLARALRARARRNHRSLQGELMDILETAVRPRPFRALALLRDAEADGLVTADEAASFVRADRDSR
jgi:plasmid stability protein